MARRRYDWNRREPLLARVTVFFTAMLLGAVVLSLFAGLYWVFDLFSHFVLQYIVLAIIFSLLLLRYKKTGWLFAALIIILFEGAKLMPYVNFNQPDLDAKYDDVKILQYNVHRTNKNIGEMARWIISQSEDVDIVVLSEVTEGWDDALRRIKWAYPYHIKEDMRGGRQMVIFSRLYIDEFEIKYIGKEKAPMLVMRGDTSGYEIPFVLYGIHPPPPVLPSYAARRNELLQLAAENIAKETAVHKLIVADFNTTRFSPVFKNMVTVSGLHDSNEGLGLGAFNTTWPSFFKNFMGIAIDNIVLSDNIKVEDKEIGPALGSDHYPVITTLKFLVDKGK